MPEGVPVELLSYRVESHEPWPPLFVLTFAISGDLEALQALTDLLHLNLQLSIETGTVTMSVRAQDLDAALDYVESRIELSIARPPTDPSN